MNFSKAIGWNYSSSALSLILPLGISFYTFKNISYVIEVYRKTITAEKKIDIYALYILIYPELIAGPIDRPQNLLNQIRQSYTFDYTRITNGLKLMAWGYFQKLVIADHLATIVNQAYSNPASYKGINYIIATFFFAIQIYCDFSAYSDIAIGAGEVLGFKFMKNFDRPYFARSISEFWRRWHISLSTWLRDYLFLPIAYFILRKLKNKPFLNIRAEYWSYCTATLLTMFIAGLWHGANWTFICWGTLMGIYLIISFITKKFRYKFTKLIRLNKFPFIHKIVSTSITFTLVCFAWIFFRSNDMNETAYIISHLYTGFGSYFKLIIDSINSQNYSHLLQPFKLGLNYMELFLDLLFTAALIIIQIVQSKKSIREYLSKKPLLIRWAIYLIFVFIILIYGKFETRQFIYTQF